MERNSSAPHLYRAAVASCAEKWAPEEAETLYLPEKINGERRLKHVEGQSYLVDITENPNHQTTLMTGVTYRTSMDMAARHPYNGTMFGDIVEGELANGLLKVVLQKKESMRLNDKGQTVNDCLNERSVGSIDRLKHIYAAKGFPLVGAARGS